MHKLWNELAVYWKVTVISWIMSVWDKNPSRNLEDKEALVVILPWGVPIPNFFPIILLHHSPLPVMLKYFFVWLSSKPYQELMGIKIHDKTPCKIGRILFSFSLSLFFPKQFISFSSVPWSAWPQGTTAQANCWKAQMFCGRERGNAGWGWWWELRDSAATKICKSVNRSGWNVTSFSSKTEQLLCVSRKNK